MTYTFVPTKPVEVVRDGRRIFCRGCTHYADRATLAWGLGQCSCRCHTASFHPTATRPDGGPDACCGFELARWHSGNIAGHSPNCNLEANP